MNWAAYASFLGFAAVLVLIPGPDFAVVTQNTLVGGRPRGVWTAAGVGTSNAVQGLAAAAGLGAVIVRIEPLLLAVRWAGIANLGITNPKVLVFYLAVLPQFLGPDAALGQLVVFALSHAVMSVLNLSTLVTVLARARRVLARRRVRRALDVATGTALLGFGVKLAVEPV